MAKPLIKLVPGAIPKLLKSVAMQRKLAKEAEKLAGSIPDVVVKPPVVGRARAREEVTAQTAAAKEALRRAARR